MEKIELFVTPKNSDKKIFFSGRVHSAFLIEKNNLVELDSINKLVSQTRYHLILRFSKFTVYEMEYTKYPAKIIQQLLRQGIVTETFFINDFTIYSDEL